MLRREFTKTLGGFMVGALIPKNPKEELGRSVLEFVNFEIVIGKSDNKFFYKNLRTYPSNRQIMIPKKKLEWPTAFGVDDMTNEDQLEKLVLEESEKQFINILECCCVKKQPIYKNFKMFINCGDNKYTMFTKNNPRAYFYILMDEIQKDNYYSTIYTHFGVVVFRAEDISLIRENL